ncbi:5-(carboxyamino)imidazole ribonucleotide mutase [Kiritimatiella glycovorans]|uniref:N5-carboxyaminoimidazole ribonucleotide mutase n=1 Tax=Kiritimatiella glycovorans TaxID=1307763 RepID=A0A0G3EI25_9BACT|nr:5-(carboxyamino)imidazole ribonucleotide mutase [Kiritimatiella glycovorans]AKJ65087.1 N5-carboxyaminoimidazole ribonucleotide mutase [Kiritimatiella glycovorans]
MTQKNGKKIGIVMGSRSDWKTMEHTVSTLQSFDLECEVRVMSAHRTPEDAAEWARTARERGLKVIIAAAGGAAHLGGVVSAHTSLPVLGIPLQGWALDGMDALLSTVQMPKGIPVGTLAIGKAGAINAAMLAIRILALEDDTLQLKLEEHRDRMAEETRHADRGLNEELDGS